MNKLVKFSEGSMNEYKAIGTKDPDELYVVTDRGVIYKGDTDITSSIIFVDYLPIVPISEKFYFNKTDKTLNVFLAGDWMTLNGNIDDGVVEV